METYLKRHETVQLRGEWLLQTHIFIGEEVQPPSSDWTRATIRL